MVRATPGFHDETNAIKQLLHKHGGTPLVSQLNEDTILGIGGGIGYGYFTFFYEKEDFSNFFFGTRANWENHTQFIQETFEHLGIRTITKHTKSNRLAFDQLLEGIEADNPPIVALHMGLFEGTSVQEKGYPYYTVIGDVDCVKATGEVAYRYSEPVTFPLQDLENGRSQLATAKLVNEAIFIENKQDIPKITKHTVIQACRKGIERTIEHAYNQRMSNFGISALDNWIDRLTSKNKQSWIKAFPGPKHLIKAFFSTFSMIVHNTDGQAFRQAYARFLAQVGTDIGEPLLVEASHLFKQAGEHWAVLADQALPEQIDGFSTIKARLLKVEADIRQGTSNHEDYLKTLQEVRELRSQAIEKFSLTEVEIFEVFSSMKETLIEIRTLEQQGLGTLQQALKSNKWEES